MASQAPSRIRPTPLLTRCRRPWTGWVQVLAAVTMILSPLPSGWASWSDTDSDGSNDTWTDPITSQVTTLADLNLQNNDADNDGATNDEEAAEGSDPFSFDTDLDGLSDGDELHIVKPILGVSLTNWDTSGNEVSDYDEWHNFSGVTYPGGQLPNFPGASYSDYDGDGYKNPEDPFPTDPTNYSSTNGIEWYGDVFGDADGDGTLNWEDWEPYGPPASSDSDGDGIEDSSDPFPSDSSNYSYTNGYMWYGDVLGDADSDGTPNWNDPEPYGPPASSDSDGDGIDDSSDPFPSDSSNYSSANGISWYSDVFGDSDSDGTVNWEDYEPYGPSGPSDSDGDGIEDSSDPFPNDSSNYSGTNSIYWYGDVLGDADIDGTPNWNDSEPYGVPDGDSDGIADSVDPYPGDSANYSSHNYVYWYGDVLGDADSDGTLNWEDYEPYGPTSPGDSDGDGIADDVDPYPSDSTNYSALNGTSWYGDVLGDADSDGSPNWEDSDPYGSPDGDSDGFADSADPFPSDNSNYSAVNGITWYGDVLGDADSDGTPNWQDYEPYGPPPNNDADSDGIEDSYDPFPNDYANYSDVNSTYWYGEVLNDADGDWILNHLDPFPNDVSNYSPINGRVWGDAMDVFGDMDYDGFPNWADSDHDGDNIPSLQDPVSDDATNHSTINNISWYEAALGDEDNDGDLNWYDIHPYNPDVDEDGILDGPDPFPEDTSNYSTVNQTAWMGDVLGDLDGDSILNWEDQYPSDPYNGVPPPDQDGDGLNLVEETAYGTSDTDVDCDDDGLTDYEEKIVYQTDPLNAHDLSQELGWGDLYTDYDLVDVTDSDNDGIPNRIEALYGLQPNNAADGMGDLDGNGMSNVVQYNAGLALNVDLDFYDADGDGMTDILEDYYGLNKNSFADAVADSDSDGVINFEEAKLLLSPLDPDTYDSGSPLGDLAVLMEAMLYPEGGAPESDADGDGITDWMAAALVGASPRFSRMVATDLDGDGMSDAWEHTYGRWKYPTLGLYLRHDDAADDPDEDDLTNIQEHRIGTHPLIGDSDSNLVDDGQEDPDGDGLTNAQEFMHGTNPLVADTDGDGVSDGLEVADETDPLDALSYGEALGLRVFTELR